LACQRGRAGMETLYHVHYWLLRRQVK
jgi:hypothetical protein